MSVTYRGKKRERFLEPEDKFKAKKVGMVTLRLVEPPYGEEPGFVLALEKPMDPKPKKEEVSKATDNDTKPIIIDSEPTIGDSKPIVIDSEPSVKKLKKKGRPKKTSVKEEKESEMF